MNSQPSSEQRVASSGQRSAPDVPACYRLPVLRALIAAECVRADLYLRAAADEHPGTPAWNEQMAKFGAARERARELHNAADLIRECREDARDGVP